MEGGDNNLAMKELDLRVPCWEDPKTRDEMMKETIRRFGLKESSHPDSKANVGGTFFRERIQEIATECCATHEGNLIEIGCYAGQTSEVLAVVAQRFNRKLVCVDNWREGTEYDLPKIKKEFDKRMGVHKNVSVINADAHNSSTVMDIRKRGPYCFALSDDGHDYMNHLCELVTLSRCMESGVIAVDDYHHGIDVSMAVEDLIHLQDGWKLYKESHLREAYLER